MDNEAVWTYDHADHAWANRSKTHTPAGLPRWPCPLCGRMTGRTETGRIYRHVELPGLPCPGSGRKVGHVGNLGEQA